MTLAAVFLLIAIHKDVQKKVIAEIDEHFTGENILMEDLNKYKYVDYVVKETLRLFPTIPIVPRKVTHEFKLNEYTIPKDTILLEFIYALHRNPDVWGEDVLDFKPERFEPENYSKIDPNAYVPFASGRRMCIGECESSFYSQKILIKSNFRQQILHEFPQNVRHSLLQAFRSELVAEVQRFNGENDGHP
jgi:cytochrome P450